MEQSEIDFNYLNDAIKEDEIIKSKGKIQRNVSTEKRSISGLDTWPFC